MLRASISVTKTPPCILCPVHDVLRAAVSYPTPQAIDNAFLSLLAG